MTSKVHGFDVDVAIVFGNVHQVCREYDDSERNGQWYPGGRTEIGLPCFADFRQAADHLMKQPWTGCIQTYVADEHGNKSWITNGVHFRKTEGERKL